MNFRLHQFWLLAALSWGLALNAPAQDKIVFSKPADASAEKSSAAPSGTSGGRLWSAGAYNAPHPGATSPGADLPAPPPVIYQPNPSAQDAQNKRKNWGLLTPEQIMNIKTPEQIMGLPDPKTDGKSLEEQYLLREGGARAFAQTNGRAGMVLRGNTVPFATSREEQNAFGREGQASPRVGEQRSSGGLFSRMMNGDSSAGQSKPGSSWSSVFAQPSAPKTSPAEAARMEDFRAMLEPPTPVEKPATPQNNYSAVAMRPADPYLQPQPAFNPAGKSVAPLESHVVRPVGIQPLPGVATRPTPAPAKRPSWQAQLPPWMSDKPQAHDVTHGF